MTLLNMQHDPKDLVVGVAVQRLMGSISWSRPPPAAASQAAFGKRHKKKKLHTDSLRFLSVKKYYVFIIF